MSSCGKFEAISCHRSVTCSLLSSPRDTLSGGQRPLRVRQQSHCIRSHCHLISFVKTFGSAVKRSREKSYPTSKLLLMEHRHQPLPYLADDPSTLVSVIHKTCVACTLHHPPSTPCISVQPCGPQRAKPTKITTLSSTHSSISPNSLTPSITPKPSAIKGPARTRTGPLHLDGDRLGL